MPRQRFCLQRESGFVHYSLARSHHKTNIVVFIKLRNPTYNAEGHSFIGLSLRHMKNIIAIYYGILTRNTTSSYLKAKDMLDGVCI